MRCLRCDDPEPTIRVRRDNPDTFRCASCGGTFTADEVRKQIEFLQRLLLASTAVKANVEIF